MPKQSEAQIIGDAGELWFQKQLPPGWLFQKPTRDVGIDGVVVVCEEGGLNGREFRTQIKSSRAHLIEKERLIVRNVKWTTLDYWFRSPLPTMVVAVDLKTECGYYQWHAELLHILLKHEGVCPPQTVTLSIPTKNELSREGWSTIRKDLADHYENLARHINEARDARSTLPTIHTLADAARFLNSVDHQSAPLEKRTLKHEGYLAIVEMIQHNRVLKAVDGLLAELRPDSDGANRLSEWVAQYRVTAQRVFPTLETLPMDQIPLDYQLVFDRNSIHAVRPRLIEAVLHLIVLLAPNAQ